MKNIVILFLSLLLFLSCSQGKIKSLASTPPMGWNSWDCFGVDLNETDLKANADYMAEKLKAFGWEYIVTDILWYGGASVKIQNFKDPKPEQRIDEFGRLIPATNRYPSAVEGSFKPVADYVHSKGLKFGIHIMRGIPWQAVEQNTPILGTEYHAQDIAVLTDTCTWYDGMYGIDMKHPGGQAYYNSIIQLYAEWGVDYIKADDICQPYHAKDIEALHDAILVCGRPIVLSLSPGAAPIEEADHLKANANMWRISPDFWDDWKFLYRQFELCQLWQEHITPGHWPDADMLPLGKLRKHGSDDYVLEAMNLTMDQVTNEYSRFTDPEKQTMMTLWCIARSPLILGGNLPETDDFTFSLITNQEALNVNQNSMNNHQLYREGDRVAWVADVSGSKDKYIAMFNIGEDSVPVSVTTEHLSISGPFSVRNLWQKSIEGQFAKEFVTELPPHSSGLFRLIIN